MAKTKLKVFVTPYLFFSDFAETRETHGCTFHKYLKDKWLGATAEVEEIIPCMLNAKGKVKFRVSYYEG